MTSDNPQPLSFYCTKCTNVLEEEAVACPDCDSPAPSEGWASTQDGFDPWLGRSLDGRYFITKRLGRGSVGAVYRARSVAIARSFAIKIVNLKQTPAGLDAEQIRARLKREVLAIGKLRNPHIVPFYETIELYGSFIGVVMDLVEGETLEDVARQETLSVPRVLKILRQIANGLHEAHTAGMIHRDLKPENIMLEKLPAGDDFIHILDFGIVRMDDGVSMTRGFLGTPLYASPEQAMAGEIDARSDIYALGAITFFLLSGRPPFVSENVYEILRAHVSSPVPSLSEHSRVPVPQKLEDLVTSMLAKAPTSRPQSLADVIEAIDALQRSVSAAGRDSASIDPIPRETHQTGPQNSVGTETSEQLLGHIPADEPTEISINEPGPKAAIFKRGPTRGTVKDILDNDRSNRTFSEYDYVVRSETGVFHTGIQVGARVTSACEHNGAIACIREGKSIWVKNGATPKRWFTLEDATLTSICFDGSSIIVGNDAGEVCRVTETGHLKVLFSDVRRAPITAVDAGYGVVMASSESGRLYRSLNSQSWTRIQDGPPIDVCSVSHDGTMFAVGRRNQEIQMFRVNDPKRTVSTFTIKSPCRAAAFSTDCQLLATALVDESVAIHHVVAEETLMNVRGDVGSMISLYFNASNELHGFFERDGVLLGLDLNRTLTKVQS